MFGTRRRIFQSAAIAVLVLTAPLLLAPKCVAYDPGLGASDDASEDAEPNEAAVSDAPGMDGDDRDGADGVTPAVPCPNPGEAQLRVRNLEYVNLCGCAEAMGRTCTIAAGTTVHWIFADSVEHNVSSLEQAFGRSSDRLSGRFTAAFPNAGRFGYGCTLHPREMSGYAIIVE